MHCGGGGRSSGLRHTDRAADGDMGRVGRIGSGVHEPDGDGGSGSE
jgi:hypothetical protein